MDLSKFSFSTILLLFYVILNPADGGKLLVIPMDGSHWLSMRPLVEKLTQNGHDVLVVIPESSLSLGGSEKYTVRTFSVPYTSQEMKTQLEKFGKQHFTFPSHFPWVAIEMLDSMMVLVNMLYKICESLLLNQELIEKLRDEKFDAVLTDPASLCGVILAEHLDLPNVNFLRGLPCAYDYGSAHCETPISYVPRLFSKSSDKMTFIERVNNLMIRLLETYYCGTIYSPWVRLTTGFLKKDVTPVQLLSRSSMWLLRYDFIFEYPKPIMPNMVFVGGINCGLRKSLPKVRTTFHQAKTMCFLNV
ncbi:UDP-glucuronosyltransferase 1A6-like [Leptodactylus fuscus]|uniref:UDP-glucuronosyltransferase 1A6-like n=1 Tax=Leptodactylus fuscus TaxID=238119 RepID=UPI003F4E673E